MNKQTVYIKLINPEEYLITLRNNILTIEVNLNECKKVGIVLVPDC